MIGPLAVHARAPWGRSRRWRRAPGGGTAARIALRQALGVCKLCVNLNATSPNTY